MEPFYRKIFGQTWHLIKQNFHLLFFGLFASLLSFNEIKMLFFDFQNNTPDFLGSWIIVWWNNIQTLMNSHINMNNIDSLISLIGLFIIFAIILILAVSSQGALIYSTAKYNTKSGKGRGSDGFAIALEKFWPLLGINLINTVIGYFFISFIISPTISLIALNSGLTFYFLLSLVVFFLLVPLVVMISFATRFGMAYIVLKDQKLWEAFNNGWELFRANWLITVESAITIMIVALVFTAFGFAILAFIFAPFIILALFIQVSPLIFYLLIILGSFIMVVMFILITAFFGAFYNLLWANIFIRLNGRIKTHSKVHRFAHRHLPALTR